MLTTAQPAIGILQDGLGRTIRDLRLAVTDRCNFRCVYCRTGITPEAGYNDLPYDELVAIIDLFAAHGIEKIRFTGGEPLLRPDLARLIAHAATLRTGSGRPLDLALTTNGARLVSQAQILRRAGLNRVTVSLDAINAEAFTRIARVPAANLAQILDGIHAAQDAGLAPVKINCVLIRGMNDDQIEAFAHFARSENLIVRFIEFMPLEEPGSAPGGWSSSSVVPLAELRARLERIAPLVELPPNDASETARRYTFADGRGEIGIIAPVSTPFCGHCSRIRVTADGKLRTCLFSTRDHDLIARMRSKDTGLDITDWLHEVIAGKEPRHHIGEPGFLKPHRAMVQIGG